MISALDTGIHKTLCIAQYLRNTHYEIHWYEQWNVLWPSGTSLWRDSYMYIKYMILMAAEVQIFSVCKWQTLTVHSTLTLGAIIAQWTVTTRWTAGVSFLIVGWSLHLKQVLVAIQCPLQQELWQGLEAITYLSPMPKLQMRAVLKIPFSWDMTVCREHEDWGFRSVRQQVIQVTKFFVC